MTSIPHNITAGGISFIVDSRSKIIPKNHKNYDQIVQAVRSGDAENLKKLVNLAQMITKYTNGKVKVGADNFVYYGDDNVKIPVYLGKRILDNIENNEPVGAICKLTEKLMENPEKETGIIDDFFNWLEIGNMPICDDGDFIAYKKVKADYHSSHTDANGNTVLQKPGTVVSMPRENCNNNRDHVCSTGLHFCSYDYLSQFGVGGESKIIILKINPSDVVAIPTDYGYTKGRCCRFEVIGEVPEEDAKEFFSGSSVVSSFGTYANNDQEDDEESWGDNSWEEDDEDTSVKNKPEKQVGMFYSGIHKYSLSDIRNAFLECDENITQTAKQLDVPRSTLRGWIKKIYG